MIDKVTFKATDEQVLQMAANAVNASNPVGVGAIMYNPGSVFSKTDFCVMHSMVSVDYCGGRMTKFIAIRHGDYWKMREPHPEYQSWIRAYPTAKDLIESAGATVMEVSDAARE